MDGSSVHDPLGLVEAFLRDPAPGELVEWEQELVSRPVRPGYRRSTYEERLEDLLRAALPVVSYVSAGRSYVDVEPYPDATARRVNAQIRALLGEEPTS